MKLNINFAKQAGVFILFVLGFWIISALYLKPAIGGEKVLRQGDMQQVRLMRAEGDSFKAKYGEFPGWTDGMFSGMPSTLISGIPNGNLVYMSGIIELFHLVNTPFNFLFVAMLSMFILLLSSGVNRWLAAAGGIGYAFMTFSITSYEAGHITKVLAMATLPGVLSGFVLLNRKKYLFGGVLLGVFWALLVGYFHYQIAYYAGIVAGIFLAVEVVKALMGNETRHALIMAGVGVACLLAGVLANVGKIYDTASYSGATMRGGSELASETPKQGPQQSQVAKKGLERDYAFAWSYSPDECLTLLIPRYKGGSSGEYIGPNDLTGDEPIGGFYWGELQFTSGPVYLGAVFIFLFILAIVVVLMYMKTFKGTTSAMVAGGIFWFSIISVAVSLILAWGRFFPFNNTLFDLLPYYNKFRTPMMTLAIAQVVVPFFGLYGLNLLLTTDFSDELRKKIVRNTFIAAAALMGTAALVLFSASYTRDADAAIRNAKDGAAVFSELKALREKVAWQDWFRSMAFIFIPLGLVWLVVIKKQSKTWLWIGIIVLASIDMIGISKRYLNDNNWEDKDIEDAISPSRLDQQLMAVNTDHARVFDLRYNPFNDAHSAPWHRGIGGYHPAKLSRYQDLISYCITPNGGNMTFESLMNNNALDMLNCRYILTKQEKSDKEEVIERPTALGNAWFVKRVIHVSGARQAVETINSFKPGSQVVIEDAEKVKPSADSFSVDSNASIQIGKYGLDTIIYKVNNTQRGLAVFSEIYYNEKNGSWHAFADGKELPVMKVDYIMRGLEVPAGTREIKMIYQKESNRFISVEMASSGILLLLLVFVIGRNLFQKDTPPAENA